MWDAVTMGWGWGTRPLSRLGRLSGQCCFPWALQDRKGEMLSSQVSKEKWFLKGKDWTLLLAKTELIDLEKHDEDPMLWSWPWSPGPSLSPVTRFIWVRPSLSSNPSLRPWTSAMSRRWPLSSLGRSEELKHAVCLWVIKRRLYSLDKGATFFRKMKCGCLSSLWWWAETCRYLPV